MEVQPDFRELLELFNAHNVDFVIVGGYAVAWHGAPRFTGDLDLYVRPDPENASRVLSALSAFGFGSVGLAENDFVNPDRVIQLGFPPVRIIRHIASRAPPCTRLTIPGSFVVPTSL